jgi:hypothetical protein
MTRINLLPDPRFAPLGPALEERMAAMTVALAGEKFAGFLDPLATRGLEHAFRLVGAGEGTLWIADQEETHLIPVFNNGPNRAALVGVFRQPLTAGIISMVYGNEQGFCENEVYRNADQDKTLDQKLKVLTCGMIAVPFYFNRGRRGVLSCVKLKPNAAAPDPSPFVPADLTVLQTAAASLSRQVDGQLLAIATGWGGPRG